MLDWLLIWGASKVGWLLFKPVLEELAKDATKDWVKDWFKDCLNDVIPLPKMDVFKTAAGQASTKFLALMQEHLEDEDLSEEQIKTYIPAMKRFMGHRSVLAILGEPFGTNCNGLDCIGLAKIWKQQNAKDIPENLQLPDNFNWSRIGKRYVRKVMDIRQSDDELRQILDSQNQKKTADVLQELQGIQAPFDLLTYQESLLEQYQHLKLESLDTTGYAYNELKLWRMFVEQSVRECQEFSPKVYELPRELRQKLKDDGALELEFDPETQERMRKAYVDQSPKPVLEVIHDESSIQRSVILGDPGSGKSTLLQYLALDWAEKTPQELFTDTVPLLIELRLYARNRKKQTCKTFLEFLDHGTGLTYHLNHNQLHKALGAGQIIALFDGLDEIFDPELREEVKGDIHRFSNEYPLVSMVVTSRWLGYKAQQLRDAQCFKI